MLFLSVPLLMGYLLSGTILREPRRLVKIALSLFLGTAFTLLPLNFLLVFCSFSISKALGGVFVLQLGLIAALFSRRQLAPAEIWDRPQKLALAFSGLIYLSALAYRLLSPDDDYFVHAPIQGLISRGQFPPSNPFFSDIPMHGHYGRDLLIGALSAGLKVDVIALEIVSTALWQWACSILLWDALGSAWPVLLIFFGVNCGLNSGLNFLPLNNNPIAYLYTAAALWFFGRHRQLQGAWGVGLLWGLSLGGLAILYETHFGLCVLATGSALILGGASRAYWIRLLLPASLAAGLALTQGGPLTELWRKPHQASQLSQGLQNQSQQVKLTVPKAQLGQIRLQSRANPQARLSSWHHTFLPGERNRLRPEAGYTPIWSWEFLKLHSPPVYLAPLTLWLLWRRGCRQGLWLWWLGFWAFVVPALVDFGPVYEAEYMRWEFAAGLAWAGCLGLLVLHYPSWKGPRVLAVLCCVPAVPVALVQWQAFNNWPGPKRWLLLPPSGPAWLQYQGEPAFQPADVALARYLRQHSQPGERVLVDSDQENSKVLVYESTLTALAGLRCVGHSFPLDEEEIGLPPYRLASVTAGFWARPNLEALRQLQVNWVVRRVPASSPVWPGFASPKIFTQAGQERQLYAIASSPAISLPLGPPRHQDRGGTGRLPLGPPRKLPVQLRAVRSVRSGSVYSASLEGVPAGLSWALVSRHDQQLSPLDWIWNQDPGALLWLAPHSLHSEESLQLFGRQDGKVFAVEGARWPVRLDYRQRVAALQPRARWPALALPNQVIEAEVEMAGSASLAQEGTQPWLVALEFEPLAGQPRVDRTQGRRARLQRTSLDGQGRMRVYGQVPMRAGPYLLRLIVDPGPSPAGVLEWPLGQLEAQP